jgi:hypothetical protein
MSKYTSDKFLSAILFLGFTLGGSALAVPRSHPITCRGGDGSLVLTTSNNNATFNFIKSSGPASDGLQAGQCAWHDRAVGAGEPSCIQQYNTNATARIFPGRKEDSDFSSATGRHWLKDLLSDSNYVTFQAYNPHSGACLVVTRVGE